MTTNDLVTATLKMEGERFRLFKKIDACTSLYEYPHLQRELWLLSNKIEQYQNTVKAMRELSKIKRKMLK
jgi:hypothetical protein